MSIKEIKQVEDKIICRVKDIERAQERLKLVLDDEIFNALSKHDPCWNSKSQLQAQKLDELRRKLSCMNDNLWDIMGILRK